ncbi:MAG TPA: amidohydrolase family protein, partial [Candidatus Polarisedimenticolia bacterium]|nr:amidohydrolase family protein [Candidatus Polarisedimenticolia bacterium]
PDQPAVYAEYYPTQMFGARGPDKALIDKYVPDRPVIWEDWAGHAVALNSKALALMGIDKDTPDPEPGVSYFVRDAQGNPTGWVKEGAHESFLPKLYKAINWSPPQEVSPDLLNTYLERLSAYGEVAVFDAGGSQDTFKALSALDSQGKLHLYYEGSRVFETLAELPQRIAEVRDWQARFGGKHVRVNTMKLYLDGTSEISTSALLEPFANDPRSSGRLRLSPEDLVQSLLRLNREAIDLHIHVTGDRAFRAALDAVEAARKQLGDAWRIQVTLAHCELISDQDFPRVARLGVLINWTPHWSGGSFQGLQETLGMERYNNMYRFQPIISTGGTVDFGSDVVSLYEWDRANPYLGMQIAHTRFDTDSRYQVHGVRKPVSEMLQLRDLMKGYTINGAVQLRLADRMGSIEVGKLANLVVLDKDLFSVPADQIQFIHPVAVMFEGKIVQGALGP